MSKIEKGSAKALITDPNSKSTNNFYNKNITIFERKVKQKNISRSHLYKICKHAIEQEQKKSGLDPKIERLILLKHTAITNCLNAYDQGEKNDSN